MGPKEARSTALTREEEAIIVAFRRHTLLPLGPGLDLGLPLWAPAHHPASHPLEPASLPGAPRHQRAAPDRGRQAPEQALRRLCDRRILSSGLTRGFNRHHLLPS